MLPELILQSAVFYMSHPMKQIQRWKIEPIWLFLSGFKRNCLCIFTQPLQTVAGFTNLFFPQLFCITTARYHARAKVWWRESIHNSKKQQGTSCGVVTYNKLRRKRVEFVSSYGGWLHYTYCRSRWVWGNRIYDGWPTRLGSHSSGLFIYLSAYLFIPSPRETLTNLRFA